MKTTLADELGLEYPIFAFSKTPEVVAAVSRAGGMGVLGAVAYDVAQLAEILDYLDRAVEGRPYGVDVVMPARYAGSESQAGGLDEDALRAMIPDAHKHFVAELLERYGVPPLPPGQTAWHDLLAWTEAATRPQVELALKHPIKLLANALGPPPADIVAAAHDRGIKVAALTGSVRHAEKHVANGVDILIAQGTEAGGHCGEIGTMVLVPDVVDAVAPVPVLAAGGIGCGRQIAASLALGAQGVWTGSIWLTAKESDVVPMLKAKLLAAGANDTVRSKAISGKPARQLKTAWSEEWGREGNPTPLPIPLQWMLTAEATSRIFAAAEDPASRARELLTSPVGQVVGRMREVRPVAEIMASLVTEYREAAAKLSGMR